MGAASGYHRRIAPFGAFPTTEWIRMPAATSLGGAIRNRRKELGLTQQVAAELAGVSAKFLRDLEHGKPSVQLDKVLAVLDVLGLELTAAVRAA